MGNFLFPPRNAVPHPLRRMAAKPRRPRRAGLSAQQPRARILALAGPRDALERRRPARLLPSFPRHGRLPRELSQRRGLRALFQRHLPRAALLAHALAGGGVRAALRLRACPQAVARAGGSPRPGREGPRDGGKLPFPAGKAPRHGRDAPRVEKPVIRPPAPGGGRGQRGSGGAARRARRHARPP